MNTPDPKEEPVPTPAETASIEEPAKIHKGHPDIDVDDDDNGGGRGIVILPDHK